MAFALTLRGISTNSLPQASVKLGVALPRYEFRDVEKSGTTDALLRFPLWFHSQFPSAPTSSAAVTSSLPSKTTTNFGPWVALSLDVMVNLDPSGLFVFSSPMRISPLLVTLPSTQFCTKFVKF